MPSLGAPVSFLATANPDKSRHFYEAVLGLTCQSEDSFALVFKLEESTLRVQKVEAVPKVNHTVLGWDVANIEDCVKELTRKGVSFERYAQLPQNELGIWPSPSGAQIAWFKDPDGNILSVTQY